MKRIMDVMHPTATYGLVIAEVAQTHDGSLGQAHAFIDAAAAAGADAIKFQTHIAAAESTPAEPFRVKFSSQDATRYDYWRRMEFTPAQWQELCDHAKEKKLIFLSSPFSPQAVEMLQKMGMEAWKVASGEITNLPLLRQMAATGKPMLISTGLAGWGDIDRAVQLVQDAGAPLALFQTTTMYPTPPEKIGLNILGEFKQRYGCAVGLSDHSATPYAGLAAYMLGARLIEVHVTLSKQMFGPDVSSSLTMEELSMLVRGLRFMETACHSPADKEEMAQQLAPLKTLFGKSVVAARPLAAGSVLEPRDLALKKPGGGIAPEHIEQAYGKTLKRAVAIDEALGYEDIQPAIK